jgi:hypothetical protein
MPGSASEADDAVQEAWLRLDRAVGVGLALLVVLDTLTPAERLAFVLHDMSRCPSTRSPRSSTSRAAASRPWSGCWTPTSCSEPMSGPW